MAAYWSKVARRVTAIWALARLDLARFEAEKAARFDTETEQEVSAEWTRPQKMKA